jgi:hypothetical protein
LNTKTKDEQKEKSKKKKKKKREDKGWISFGVRIFSIVVVPGETMRTRK